MVSRGPTVANSTSAQLAAEYGPLIRQIAGKTGRSPTGAIGLLLGAGAAALLLRPDADLVPPTTTTPGTSGGNDPNDPDDKPKILFPPLVPPPGDDTNGTPAPQSVPNPVIERQVGINANGDAILVDMFGNTFIRDRAGNVIPTDSTGTALRSGGRLVDNIPNVPNPPRIAAGVVLDPRLPEPVAGLDYAPSRLTGGTAANQLSQINGYRAELEFANTIAAIPGENVVRFGSNVNTSGADIISVNANGTVSLFDTKFRSNPVDVKPTTTFAQDSRPLAKALVEARIAIDKSTTLSPATKAKALENLDAGNFNAHTPGAGAARNSAITRFCGNKVCGG